MRIRPVAPPDLDEWLRMRRALWPQAKLDELRSELGEYLGPVEDRVALIAERPDGRLCGFIELSLRNVVNGCTSSPVGYIEGWFVDGDSRKLGVGRALVAAGEDWARDKGCSEMGSDTELDNRGSQGAHAALGYEVTDRLVSFRKPI